MVTQLNKYIAQRKKKQDAAKDKLARTPASC